MTVASQRKKGFMGRRAEKKEEVRSRIIEAAMPMFEEQGFEKTTFEQIASKAGVSVRTCTRHFASKNDLVFTFHHERLERFRTALERHYKAINPIEGILSAFLELVGVYEAQSSEFLREWRFISASPALSLRDMELDGEYERLLTEILMRGHFDEAESTIIAATIFMAVRATMNQWFVDQCRSSLLDEGQFLFSLLHWLSQTYRDRQAWLNRERTSRNKRPSARSTGRNREE